MNVDELKTSAIKLSDNIEQLIVAFESETGCCISSIGLNRIDVSAMMEHRSRLLNVDVKVEI